MLPPCISMICLELEENQYVKLQLYVWLAKNEKIILNIDFLRYICSPKTKGD